MDGSLTPLQFPVAAPPRPGETLPIAPGVHWLRMPLPFALDHINLWLLEDGAGWTIVDTGYAMAQTQELWERIFAERLGRWPVTRVIVTHLPPGPHRARRLADPALAGTVVGHREGMAVRPGDEPWSRRFRPDAA